MVVATVIGGAGGMGTWMAKFLKANGYAVTINDQDMEAAGKLARTIRARVVNDQATAIRDAQLIVLATPTSVTRTILRHLHPEDCKNRLLVEISSVKQPLRSALREAEKKGIFVLSIHPMFGPGTASPRGRTVLVMPRAKQITLANNFLKTLQQKGARLLECGFTEHDKLIAAVLTLPHFLNVAFADTLRSLGVDLNLLSRTAGPTFRLQLLLAEELHQESAENETSILMDNNESAKLLRRYSAASSKMVDAITRGKRIVVHRKLLEGRRFLNNEKQFLTAYARFNQAVSASSFA